MTILRRAAPTRWLYPAILLLLFMEKSSALEIAGYGGSASWTQVGAAFESDGSDAPGSILSFSQACSSARVTLQLITSPCTNGNPVRAPGHGSVILSQALGGSEARLFRAMATWLRSATILQHRFGPPACSTT